MKKLPLFSFFFHPFPSTFAARYASLKILISITDIVQLRLTLTRELLLAVRFQVETCKQRGYVGKQWVLSVEYTSGRNLHVNKVNAGCELTNVLIWFMKVQAAFQKCNFSYRYCKNWKFSYFTGSYGTAFERGRTDEKGGIYGNYFIMQIRRRRRFS